MLHRKRRGQRESADRAVFRRFWLDRFSVDECVVMGRAIASLSRSSLPQALTAASRDPRR